MLIEVRHKTPKIVLSHLYKMSRIGKSMKKECRLMITMGLYRGGNKSDCYEYKVSFLSDENQLLK